MPSALIWFGTRKNGCGSCNQTCSILESNQDEDIKKRLTKFDVIKKI